jgi:hemoglobin-like flavoprotein
MNPHAIDVTKASYARCLASPRFLSDFYQRFFANCPAAEPLFAQTDFERQIRLLQHAIGLLIAFAHQPADDPSLLTRLARKHGPDELAIEPLWYPIFLRSLIETAAKHDPEFTPAVAGAWHEALTPGIEFMAKFH